jgi:nucleotide-binding universal stress UspA family protein
MAGEPSSHGFARIVVPTDFSAGSKEAWTVARRLAGGLGSELILLHVLVETPLYSEGPFTMKHTRGVFEAARAWVEKTLGEWTAAAAAAGLSTRWMVRSGVPHAEIADVARQERADLIVMGTHGRGGLDRALLGSVADRVIRIGPCPVMAVRTAE